MVQHLFVVLLFVVVHLFVALLFVVLHLFVVILFAVLHLFVAPISTVLNVFAGITLLMDTLALMEVVMSAHVMFVLRMM